MSRPALFLDRDGVINVDHGYVHSPENFEFVDGIFELVTRANQCNWLVVVVTNQAGIGRGFYSEGDFARLTAWMKDQFVARGASIDAVYHCPFHPEHGIGEYRRESEWRKPGPGMLLQAKRDHSIEMQRSVLVGDKSSDMEAGRRAGVGVLLHLSASHCEPGVLPIQRLDQALPYLTTARQ